jgi:NAD(P)-dependent dehydrogenase (short-subunit alcohol dehydrogenase family)
MDLKLKGKRAFVSGPTAGIGFAVALGLAREGAEVVVNGRTDARRELSPTKNWNERRAAAVSVTLSTSRAAVPYTKSEWMRKRARFSKTKRKGLTQIEGAQPRFEGGPGCPLVAFWRH